MAGRKLGMQRELETTEERIREGSVRLGKAQASVETLEDEKGTIEREIAGLQGVRADLFDARDETSALVTRQEALHVEIKRLKEDHHGPGVFGQSNSQISAVVVQDLRQMPACLTADWPEERSAQPERDALQGVMADLRKLGLTYGQRTVFAFHTALKINDAAQLAVLAGVSGTGKSLLPRRYAEAMGLRFLQIAVEPRWDSPQDLLGFYNYMEKAYRATDLARALVQMDPYDTSGLDERKFTDQVLLVLLDEMNLARVEYYFSEFLSRLEVRPRHGSEGDSDKRSGAHLPIDVPGRQIRLFPSHNVLFAGTMNDDESTQSLSDKVLDRSNVMQFAAPDQFNPWPQQHVPGTGQYRSFREWRTWVRRTDALVGGEREKTMRIVRSLAEIMEKMGRPFGHRLSDGILAYVANYPLPAGGSVDTPLADQIEMRILPKLRGLIINEHDPAFDDLSKLIEQDLNDPALAGRLRDLVTTQSNGAGQFTWRGLNRGSA